LRRLAYGRVCWHKAGDGVKEYYNHGGITIFHGDCRDVLPGLEPVDAVVTDPPYGISFMGRKWDHDVPGVDTWLAIFGAAKPGTHLLSFAGTRTQHRMAVNIEDAGWEIRDMIAWLYGSGFPKSLDVSKAIDKAAGVEREIVGTWNMPGRGSRSDVQKFGMSNDAGSITTPATTEAQQWSGWGTALKPALEPITLARKPFPGTVAANVIEHGTGAINVDGCRVETTSIDAKAMERCNTPNSGQWKDRSPFDSGEKTTDKAKKLDTSKGRWPANVIHDGSDEVARGFPHSTSTGGDGYKESMFCGGKKTGGHGLGDSGSAARFFYVPKADKEDRAGAAHPTVKPMDLMKYLVKLVTPPGRTVLDPFMGTGPTIAAAKYLGFKAVGIELDERWCEVAAKRLSQECLDF